MQTPVQAGVSFLVGRASPRAVRAVAGLRETAAAGVFFNSQNPRRQPEYRLNSAYESHPPAASPKTEAQHGIANVHLEQCQDVFGPPDGKSRSRRGGANRSRAN